MDIIQIGVFSAGKQTVIQFLNVSFLMEEGLPAAPYLLKLYCNARIRFDYLG